MTEAHDQRLTIHLLCHIPAHKPRKTDPHYKAFEAMRRRMKAAGLLVCSIHGCTYPGPIEIHHSEVEYSLQAGVDVAEFDRVHGLHLTDAEFVDWIEEPGNAEPLCPVHHRTHLGVHAIPEPLWKAIRVWKPDLAPPAESVTSHSSSKSVQVHAR